MRNFILWYIVLGMGLFTFLDVEVFRFVEPLFFVFYLILYYKRYPKNLLNIGTIFAFGQLLISLSNAQLTGNILAGQSGGMYDYIIPDFMNQAHQIHFIGNACFLLGYNILKLKINWIQNTVPSGKSGLLFLVAILIILNKSFLGIKLPGSLNSLLNWVPIASILFLSRLSYIHDSKRIRSYAILLLVISVIFAFLYATLRTEMVLPIVAYFLGAFLAKPKLSFFLNPHFYPFYVGGVFFFMFFLAFGLIRGTTHGTERLQAITEARVVSEEIETEEKRGAFQRVADLAQITNCVDLRKGNNFNQGETLTVLGVALIPRFLWPSKPVIAIGVWFAVKIGKALETESGWYNTSINMTIPGHLWLEFNWVGLAIGMFIIGAFYKMIWLSCGSLRNPLNFTGSLLGSYMLITVLSGIGADLQMLITLIALFLVLIVISGVVRLVSN